MRFQVSQFQNYKCSSGATYWQFYGTNKKTAKGELATILKGSAKVFCRTYLALAAVVGLSECAKCVRGGGGGGAGAHDGVLHLLRGARSSVSVSPPSDAATKRKERASR